MIISAIIIISYTMMGGFLAASITDLIQSIVMTLALCAVLLYGINFAGGWDAVVDHARSLPGYLTLTEGYDPEAKTSTVYSGLTIASTLAWGLG